MQMNNIEEKNIEYYFVQRSDNKHRLIKAVY
jgi:hypothetical protein